MAHSDSTASAKPGTYLFELPGSSVSIYLSLDVIDRLQQEVMRGFGAVPKRGAEVGGILLGTISKAERLIVEVEDYEMAPIDYKRGPSYRLSPGDQESFQTLLDQLRAANLPDLKPVGFFRSHTRDGAGLARDDLDLLNRFFPDPDAVVLMIKPYATRVSTATFLFRENGAFQAGAPLLEFPFRRKELAPDDDTPPKHTRTPLNPSFDPRLGSDGDHPRARPGSGRAVGDLAMVRLEGRGLGHAQRSDPGYADLSESESDAFKTNIRSGWVWVPLSLIFLLLGVLLGFQAALTLRPASAAQTPDPFNLMLNVSKEGDNLNVRWDRQARAIRTGSRGVLVIVDGAYYKTVNLDPNQLQTGSVVYRHNSREVRFRLEVYPRERDTMTETVDWKE